MELEVMSTLEKRIAAALSSDTASTVLSALIAETEAAIDEADKTAMSERQKALDVLASPDATAAGETMRAAEFSCDRLRATLPRLQTRYREIAAAEELARWLPQHDAAKARRDELASRQRRLYLEFVDQFVPLLDEIEQADREIRRVNEALPNEGATGLYLHSVEEEARGGTNLMKDLRLPAWQVGAAAMWPRPFNPALFVPVLADRRYSADWGVAAEEGARALRERQERETAEQEAKARADWRGPRWWLGERA
jgi:hypothetical protein